MTANTLYLRLEGPLQAWGSHEAKLVIRRAMDTPTKSGVIGLLLCALGVSRQAARGEWLDKLTALHMGVRIDRPGMRWWDYHTVGAGQRMRTAEGKHKPGPILTRREYLCDASFLVALQGKQDLILRLRNALEIPVWNLYLGRKSCPPSRPIYDPLHSPIAEHTTILEALRAIPYSSRFGDDECAEFVDTFYDWVPANGGETAPDDASIWYDVPFSLDPPAHRPRFVVQHTLTVGENCDVEIHPDPLQSRTPAPLRPRADYTNSEYRKRREERLARDWHLCVFCKSYATTVQHISYQHAGGDEQQEELRALCRLCHDAVTMIEYGQNMGLDRINPEDPQWRDAILDKRREIILHRSLETRRRRLGKEEVE